MEYLKSIYVPGYVAAVCQFCSYLLFKRYILPYQTNSQVIIFIFKVIVICKKNTVKTILKYTILYLNNNDFNEQNEL